MSHFYFYFCQKVEFRTYLVYSHTSCYKFKVQELSQSPGLLWFSRPNLLWSRAIMALDCNRRWLPFFLVVHIRLLTQRKICFTLGLFSNYRKIPKISPGVYIFQRPFMRGFNNFGGAYVRRGLNTEGNLRFKIDCASVIVGRKFSIFALF